MFARQIVPEPLLQDTAVAFWALEGPDHTEHPETFQHQRFPQHLWHLGFSSADSWQRGAGGLWQQAPAAELQPLRLASDFLTTQGYQRRLMAELYPWAAHQLFGWALENPLALAEAAESRAIRALLTLAALGFC